MEITTLHKTPWVELRRMRDESQGVYGYDYLHETRCGGEIVAMIGFDRNWPKEYLVRLEVTPPWGMNPVISSITGGVETSILDTCIHEMYEEAGYRVDQERFKSLGSCRGTKASDTIYRLFAVDLTGLTPVDAPGDGSELEAKAECIWKPLWFLRQTFDPILATLILRHDPHQP